MTRPEDWLLNEYEIRKLRNHRYSKRAFALLLGINSGRLSEYLEGRRKITLKMANKFAQNLKLSPDEIVQLKEYISNRLQTKKNLIPIKYYQYLSDPLVFSVLTAFDINPKGMSKKVILEKFKHCPESEIQNIIERLVEMNYLEELGDDCFKCAVRALITQPIPHQVIRDGHKKRLQDVINRIDTVGPNVRHVTSLTIPFNTKKYSEVIELIEKFKLQLNDVASSGTRNQVYNLNVQLFPMSDIDPSEIK